MPVEHDEHLLLGVAVDAAHGDVDIVVAVDEVHARHIGCQHLLQIASPAGLDHLFCDQRRGHRHLCQRLCLIGGGGDGGCHACLDMVYDLHEGRRVV